MNDTETVQLLRDCMARPDTDSLIEAVLLTLRHGTLHEGTRLPTIAVLADALGLSGSTISRAWASLVQMGVLQTRRRGGTWVARPVHATAYRTSTDEMDRFRYRLAAGYPDLSLQPDLRQVLQRVADGPVFGGYPDKDRISPALGDALIARIGYQPEVVMLDTEVIGALPHVLQAVSHRGAAIGVSDPDFPLYPVILRRAGMSIVPLPFTSTGYDLAAVEAALSSGTRVLLLQTRLHSPTGLKVPTQNVADIAGLLRRHDATAIEIDHHGMLVPEQSTRLASLAPERVVLLCSFAKEIHADIRVSSISGPRSIMERISVWRAGGEWVSAINRAILEACLTDPHIKEIVAMARDEYSRRREIFREAFKASGLTIESNAGLSLWLPVDSEEEAMIQLAADSISVARGSSFRLTPHSTSHVHLSLGLVGPDSEYLSRRLVRAALAVRRPPTVY